MDLSSLLVCVPSPGLERRLNRGAGYGTWNVPTTLACGSAALAPFHLQLQLAAGDEIAWLECRFGQRGEHGMRRTPYGSPPATARLLNSLAKQAPSIDWVYQVTFGERRS